MYIYNFNYSKLIFPQSRQLILIYFYLIALIGLHFSTNILYQFPKIKHKQIAT